jgi:hypothetical protein
MTNMIHPRWCEPALCTATVDDGEHRSDPREVGDTNSVQLVQEVAVGGATPYLVLGVGAVKTAIPLRTAQALVDEAVTLLWQDEDRAVAA